ncbi:MAG: zinc ribbon domain-containing protein [Thermoplasmatota archaeon]
MGDEEDLQERQEKFLKDRRDQAKWYESLNLYPEALKIYRSIEDTVNIDRLEKKMGAEYGREALRLEKEGNIQQAANLYYLIGDHASVGRLKSQQPDLVIYYDEEKGGLARMDTDTDDADGFFEKQNIPDDVENVDNEKSTVFENSDKEKRIKKRKVPVKMPKNPKKMRFCPYCGERISTKKEPRFCPFCGDELL